MSEPVKRVETTEQKPQGSTGYISTDAAPYHLISPLVIRALALVSQEGHLKGYDKYNWELGGAANDHIDHSLEHIFNYLAGDDSEPHLAHALWRIGAALHSHYAWPKLNSEGRSTLQSSSCIEGMNAIDHQYKAVLKTAQATGEERRAKKHEVEAPLKS